MGLISCPETSLTNYQPTPPTTRNSEDLKKIISQNCERHLKCDGLFSGTNLPTFLRNVGKFVQDKACHRRRELHMLQQERKGEAGSEKEWGYKMNNVGNIEI
jgi:hypothetical protein